MRGAVIPAENDDSLKLREKAYVSFTQHLLARDIKPGQFISQRELVELTSLPLGAIRELIPRLEADGLIKTVPQRGMQIAHVDLNLIRNAFQFRLFLEREAAVLFAARVTDATLALWRAEHERVAREAEREVTAALVAQAQAIDWGFHDAIIDALGNEIVSSAYRVNSIKIRLIGQQQVRLMVDLVVPVMAEHLFIISRFEEREPQLAAEALAAHITKSRNRAMGV